MQKINRNILEYKYKNGETLENQLINLLGYTFKNINYLEVWLGKMKVDNRKNKDAAELDEYINILSFAAAIFTTSLSKKNKKYYTISSLIYNFVRENNINIEKKFSKRKKYNDIENKIKFTTLCFLKEWEKLGTEKMLNKYEK